MIQQPQYLYCTACRTFLVLLEMEITANWSSS